MGSRRRDPVVVCEALLTGVLAPDLVVPVVEQRDGGVRVVHLDPTCAEGAGTLAVCDLAPLHTQLLAAGVAAVRNGDLVGGPGGWQLCFRCNVTVASLEHLYTGDLAASLTYLAHVRRVLPDLPDDATGADPARIAALLHGHVLGTGWFLTATAAALVPDPRLAAPVDQVTATLTRRLRALEDAGVGQRARAWATLRACEQLLRWHPAVAAELGVTVPAHLRDGLDSRTVPDPVWFAAAAAALTGPAGRTGWLLMPLFGSLTSWSTDVLRGLGPGSLSGGPVPVPQLSGGGDCAEFLLARVPEPLGRLVAARSDTGFTFLPDPEGRYTAGTLAAAIAAMPPVVMKEREFLAELVSLADACAAAELATR